MTQAEGCCGLFGVLLAIALAQIALVLAAAALLVVGLVALAAYVLGWSPFGPPGQAEAKQAALAEAGDDALVADHVDRAGRHDPAAGEAFDRLLGTLRDRGHDLSAKELTWIVEQEVDRRREG